ncbi:uncharacterized protein BCR38DRAFT_505799 [Pseudomassariella vexata]|uniref:Uncharacterized protein n=1 Tax=Pseudomassariella vexata TaxID=1141098 RepID=A0A1Y2D9Q1_9PEZI|nr:uncharacterized protein BCR38DRAFT_505799 [Pseudomassariella vexata]ORY55937.1 hypothetical protein BCR38DRAFT_505799 [Pseudomassariella vexata]
MSSEIDHERGIQLGPGTVHLRGNICISHHLPKPATHKPGYTHQAGMNPSSDPTGPASQFLDGTKQNFPKPERCGEEWIFEGPKYADKRPNESLISKLHKAGQKAGETMGDPADQALKKIGGSSSQPKYPDIRYPSAGSLICIIGKRDEAYMAKFPQNLLYIDCPKCVVKLTCWTPLIPANHLSQASGFVENPRVDTLDPVHMQANQTMDDMDEFFITPKTFVRVKRDGANTDNVDHDKYWVIVHEPPSRKWGPG